MKLELSFDVSIELSFHTYPDELAALLRRPRGVSVLMARNAYELGLKELSAREPEFSLFLMGPVGHPAVTHVVPDTTGEGTPASFRIGAKRLNEVLKLCAPAGLEGKGFWHSHPPGYERLSPGDLAVVRRLFANPKNDAHEVLMPILSGGRVLPFVVRRDRPGRALPAELELF